MSYGGALGSDAAPGRENSFFLKSSEETVKL